MDLPAGDWDQMKAEILAGALGACEHASIP